MDNLIDEDKESSKIFIQHTKLKKLVEGLKNNRNQLLDTEEKLRLEQEKLNRDLDKVNNEISIKKQKIDNFIKEEDIDKVAIPGTESTAQMCERLIDNLLPTTQTEITFTIEYNNSQIEGRLEPEEDYTFFRLKQKFKRQFDKKENEFYFTDERGYVYLDDLSVRKSLFPLKRVSIKDYVPIIRVIEKKSKNIGVLDLSKRKNVEEEEINIFIDPYKFKKRLIEKAKKNAFSIFHLTSFIIFLIFWCKAAIVFRNSNQFNLMVNSFKTSSNYFSETIPVRLH
jgi:regulator of replication initiation timing